MVAGYPSIGCKDTINIFSGHRLHNRRYSRAQEGNERATSEQRASNKRATSEQRASNECASRDTRREGKEKTRFAFTPQNPLGHHISACCAYIPHRNNKAKITRELKNHSSLESVKIVWFSTLFHQPCYFCMYSLDMPPNVIIIFYLVVLMDPETVELFVRHVQDLYFQAKSSIEDHNVQPEHLTSLWIKMEAAVQHLKRIHWTLEMSKPCAEEILEMLVSNLFALESRLGGMIVKYSCLVPYLAEELCYRAPLTATGTVGRPSYIITKEQLEVMRSYALSWMDIAKALGKKTLISPEY